MRRAFAMALWGALGAGVSGLLVYLALVPFARAGVAALFFWLPAQGLCFVPLGAAMGLSLIFHSSALHQHKVKVILVCSMGGAVYGALSFFSVAGAVLGLALFSVCLTVPVAMSRSMRRVVQSGFASLALILVLVLSMKLGDRAFLYALGILDPIRTLSAVGLYGIVPLSTGFYLYNLISLLATGRES